MIPVQWVSFEVIFDSIGRLQLLCTSGLHQRIGCLVRSHCANEARNAKTGSLLAVEAFHYNTTNQCNHYVTELFDIKICYAKQKLKSIKKTIIKIGQAVSEISLYLCFGPY